MNNTEKLVNDLYSEMKKDGGFQTIPDGNYTGIVTIQAGTVKSQSSPNKGCRKYEFQFLITEGIHSGKIVYRNHVIIPATLGTPPAEKTPEYSKWKAAVKAALSDADTLLAKCGVDISVENLDELMQEIARNNRQKRKVSFDVKKGNPYINYPLDERVEEDKSSLLYQLPDGKDMPIN